MFRAIAITFVALLATSCAHYATTNIESLGLTRRFDYVRDKDMYTSHAYA